MNENWFQVKKKMLWQNRQWSYIFVSFLCTLWTQNNIFYSRPPFGKIELIISVADMFHDIVGKISFFPRNILLLFMLFWIYTYFNYKNLHKHEIIEKYFWLILLWISLESLYSVFRASSKSLITKSTFLLHLNHNYEYGKYMSALLKILYT